MRVSRIADVSALVRRANEVGLVKAALEFNIDPGQAARLVRKAGYVRKARYVKGEWNATPT